MMYEYEEVAFKTCWLFFFQFTGNVLDCILYLLDISELKDYARGNPVLVSRKLSAMVYDF